MTQAPSKAERKQQAPTRSLLRDNATIRLLRQVYAILPSPLRETLSPLKASLFRQFKLPQKGPATQIAGVTIAGLFSSVCGLGEAARLHANALEAMGIAVERLDMSPYMDVAPSLQPPAPGPVLGSGPVVIHLNPPSTNDALRLIGRRRLQGRQVIANWNWELELVPDSWRVHAAQIDEFWAPSQFTADAITRVLERPVRVVPYPVARSFARPDRAAFGLPDSVFLVLTFVDLRSNMSRKNPFAALAAFTRAASDPAMPPSCLVIKLTGADDHPEQAARVRSAIAGCPARIVVVEEPLSRAARDSLIASVDVLLSMHRCEGFGLTLAEAMAAGKRAIATCWSGNLEFMNAENAWLVPAQLVPVQDESGFYDANLRWAEPDIGAAAQALIEMSSMPALDGGKLDLRARFVSSVMENSFIAGLAEPRSAAA